MLCPLPISGIYSSAASRVCFPQFYFLTTITKPSQNCAFVLHCLLQFSSKNGHAFAFPVTQESKSCFKPSMFVSVQHPTYRTCAYFACQPSLFSLQIQGNNHETYSVFFPQCFFRMLAFLWLPRKIFPDSTVSTGSKQLSSHAPVCSTHCLCTVRFNPVCF